MWRFIPLYAGLRLADCLAQRSSTWQRHHTNSVDKPGLSILIPERGTPDLLEQTLHALMQACAALDEPYEVAVVVNGVPMDDYSDLQAAFPSVAWTHDSEPLGYSGAINRGLAVVRYEWCYLLNSDMLLAADALARILACRSSEIFAIASQIFFVDPHRRREETGLTDFHVKDGLAEIYDKTPEDDDVVRSHLYAGGGSSLYQTALLRRYVEASRDYSPFYWEDADWGAKAWADGKQVLFCPQSHAYHHHRSTIGKYYERAEIDRIIRRNATLFDLRNALTQRQPGAQLHNIAALPQTSREELAGLGVAWRTMNARLAVVSAQRRGLEYQKLSKVELHTPVKKKGSARRPRILLVSPFALYPPAHGGARRIAEILKILSDRFDVILLSDERSSYGGYASEWYPGLYAVHLVEGRGDQDGESALTTAERMRRHAWPGLRAALRRLISLYSPDIVQIEYLELAQLIDERDELSRWVLTMHDVEWDDSVTRDAMLDVLNRYDGIVTCTEDDQRLLSPLPVTVVANAATDRRNQAPPSPQNQLLFLGSFRYAPNRIGVLSFIDQCWPVLRRRFPDLKLIILAGGAYSGIATEPRLHQDGINIRDQFEEPSTWLAGASLTINPLANSHGSSVKLIESLLARRICVSTRDGARGFHDAAIEGLIIVDKIKDMIDPIAELLENTTSRHVRESSSLSHLDRFTWQNAASGLESFYADLIEA